MMNNKKLDVNNETKDKLRSERYEILYQLEEWLELPVIILGFIWLILLVMELIIGLNPLLDTIVYFIWIIFIIDFGLKFTLAPDKLLYLKKNWINAISLIAPALRIFRIVYLVRATRLVKATRGLQLIKIVGSLNRGMRSLRRTLERRNFGYIIILSIIVTLVGASGMFAFENGVPENNGFRSYGDTLWWTAMIMTTLGSGAWPQTPEGRVFAFLLSLYAFGVFGYVTATLATFFIGRDLEENQSSIENAKNYLSANDFHKEMQSLREKIERISD
ncbi:MAG: potassium channel family protein [Oligoflexia bacterium]|nr:potassium channel family protein [Oligoflexia bacterium]